MKLNSSVRSADRPRLSRQCEDILALLRLRKRTNLELAAVALKYTSRISEIRSHLETHEAQTVRCKSLGHGLTEYEIAPLGAAEQRARDLLDVA